MKRRLALANRLKAGLERCSPTIENTVTIIGKIFLINCAVACANSENEESALAALAEFVGRPHPRTLDSSMMSARTQFRAQVNQYSAETFPPPRARFQ